MSWELETITYAVAPGQVCGGGIKTNSHANAPCPAEMELLDNSLLDRAPGCR